MKMKTIALCVKWVCIEIGKQWQKEQQRKQAAVACN